MCDVLSMIKRCEVWNIARVNGDWAGRKVLFVVYVAKVLRWLKVHYKLAMGGQHKLRCVLHCKYGKLFLLHKPFRFFVFASQTLQVFRLALRKKAEYVVVITSSPYQHWPDTHTWCHQRNHVCPCLREWTRYMERVMICPYIRSFIISRFLHDLWRLGLCCWCGDY
jgi:hypothetical protein